MFCYDVHCWFIVEFCYCISCYFSNLFLLCSCLPSSLCYYCVTMLFICLLVYWFFWHHNHFHLRHYCPHFNLSMNPLHWYCYTSIDCTCSLTWWKRGMILVSLFVFGKSYRFYIIHYYPFWKPLLHFMNLLYIASTCLFITTLDGNIYIMNYFSFMPFILLILMSGVVVILCTWY